MGLDYRITSIGIIVMFFTAMMPFSAIVILSFSGTELMILGIQELFFYLGWFINPIIMIITAIVVMRVSNSKEFMRGITAGIILALTYTIVILIIQLGFTPDGPQFLPFSGIELSGAYLASFYELILKAYIFCIAGGLIGAYIVSKRVVKKTFGESFLGGMK